MADRAGAKSKAKTYTKSKKKGAMDGMTVKGGHKLPTSRGAGLTAKGRASINRRTGSNLKAPAPNAKPGTKDGNRRKSFCARSRGWTGERGKAARRRWNCWLSYYWLLNTLWRVLSLFSIAVSNVQKYLHLLAMLIMHTLSIWSV